jgi:hypothetical protein
MAASAMAIANAVRRLPSVMGTPIQNYPAQCLLTVGHEVGLD